MLDKTYFLIEKLMIEYAFVDYSDAAGYNVQSLLICPALLKVYPLKLSIRHLLRDCQTVEVILVHIHDVRGKYCTVVHRSHLLFIRPEVANTGVTYVAADVRLVHPVHFGVGDLRDQLVDLFQESIPSELLRAHNVSRVQLGL